MTIQTSNITSFTPNYNNWPIGEDEPVLKKVRINPETIIFQNNENIPETLSGRNIIHLTSESSQEDSHENSCLWRDALEDAIESGNANELVKLFQEGLLDDLDEEGIEEIADYGLIYKKREILLECAKKGLTADTRLDVLIFGIDYNDIELIQSVCQEDKCILSKWKWCADPFLVIDNYKENGTEPRILEFLTSYFSLSTATIDEYDARKFLAGLWGIEGFSELGDQEIDYQGAHIHHFIDPILLSFKQFWDDKPNAMESELLTTLFMLMNESRTSIKPDEQLKIYMTEKPIMVHAGYVEHHMEAVLWGPYLMICNKGGLSEVPVKVYSIDPNLVNVELFKIIKKCVDSFNEEKAAEFYASTLPGLLNGTVHTTLTNLFLENWIDENLGQTTDNCVWESLRTALFGMAGLDAWVKNHCENATGNEIQQQTISKALKQLLPWDEYIGMHSLEQYIDYSVKDPTKMDRTLVLSILNKAKTLVQNGKVDNVLYEEVLRKFLAVRSKAIEIGAQNFYYANQ